MITGKAPLGLHNFQVMCLRYNVRFMAYVLLSMDAWPSFEEPAGEPSQARARRSPLSEDGRPSGVAVVGGGSWGTAFANLLASRGAAVRLAFRDPALARASAAARENARYLPGHRARRRRGARGARAGGRGRARPSSRWRCRRATSPRRGDDAPGLRERRGAGVAGQGPRPRHRPAALARAGRARRRRPGPGRGALRPEPRGGDRPRHAGRDGGCVGLAGAVPRGSRRRSRRRASASTRTPTWSASSSARAAKNVIAIAAGASDGLGYGDNAKAALMTRGLAEMSAPRRGVRRRPAHVRGPRRPRRPRGDVLLRAHAQPARGLLLARGVPPAEAWRRASGWSPRAWPRRPRCCASARERGLDLPLTERVCAALDGESTAEAVELLLARDGRRVPSLCDVLSARTCFNCSVRHGRYQGTGAPSQTKGHWSESRVRVRRDSPAR